MSDGSIQYHSQHGIATIVISRPAKRNAMSAAMCEDLAAAWARLRDGDDRVAILAAEGDVFTAGADLHSPPEDFWRAVPDVGVSIGKPVILATEGPVYGLGVSLAAFCDLCVASEKASFVYPEARVGVAAGLIGSLFTRIPHKIAMELMLLGEPISAQRAHEVGFVNRVVPPGQALPVAQEMARTLADAAPLVLGLFKTLCNETLPASPVQSMYRTSALTRQVSESRDAKEGLQAFRERRPPRFTGR